MNLALCFMLTLAALSPGPEIAGTIVDDAGKPVSGINVTVLSLPADRTMRRTLSAPDGSFSFTDLPPGVYGLSAKTTSTCAFSDAIGVNAGFTRIVRLRLVKGLCQTAITL